MGVGGLCCLKLAKLRFAPLQVYRGQRRQTLPPARRQRMCRIHSKPKSGANAMKALVCVKRVIDYNVKPRV
ncbi:hypothetical protein, partial [Novosphingobium sp. AAP83]|uniref:hypothetical protein n=1 Tax=Novosphingobium sp. AAP83 TaxID=1523425 RepID=UPI001E45D787